RVSVLSRMSAHRHPTGLGIDKGLDMLKTTEVFGCTIAEAGVGSLILPRSNYDHPAVIGTVQGAPFIVFIGGAHRFRGFPSSGNTNYGGLIVPDASFEIDETSVIDPYKSDAPLGAIICREGLVCISAAGEHAYRGENLVELGACHSKGTAEVAFLRWHVA